jgi:hypothetical protein
MMVEFFSTEISAVDAPLGGLTARLFIRFDGGSIDFSHDSYPSRLTARGHPNQPPNADQWGIASIWPLTPIGRG